MNCELLHLPHRYNNSRSCGQEVHEDNEEEEDDEWSQDAALFITYSTYGSLLGICNATAIGERLKYDDTVEI